MPTPQPPTGSLLGCLSYLSRFHQLRLHQLASDCISACTMPSTYELRRHHTAAPLQSCLGNNSEHWHCFAAAGNRLVYARNICEKQKDTPAAFFVIKPLKQYSCHSRLCVCKVHAAEIATITGYKQLGFRNLSKSTVVVSLYRRNCDPFLALLFPSSCIIASDVPAQIALRYSFNNDKASVNLS